MNIIKKYTGRSLWIAGLMLTALMTGCSGGGGGSSTAPTVVETAPASSAIGVALNSKVTATFSKAMDESTITPESFTVTDASGTALPGILEYDAESKMASFDTNTNFEASADYTATVTTMAKSATGISLAADHVWTFTTGIVVETAPAPGATGVLLNSKVIITFSEAMDAATITNTSFTVTSKDEVLVSTPAIAYDPDSKTAVFVPGSGFLANTLYTATVTTAVKSSAGTPLAADYVWSFTTGAEADSTPPTVESTNPSSDIADLPVTDVPLNRSVSANFSEALDPASIKPAVFTLSDGTTSVPGVVSYSNKVATFNPTDNLDVTTEYFATLTTGIEDLAGNHLAVEKVWSFTTGTNVALGPKPVNLRTAGDFVILTKAGITNTDSHLSAITGNIGTSPITAAAMDNVWCSEMTGTGKIYGVNPAYTGSSDISCFKGTAPDKTYVDIAVLDMGTAYTDAAGRTGTDFTELHAGNLSGKTLVPGLYKWSNSVLINAGGVTLSGGANDVWIFQIAGNVTQASATHVNLTGGALAKNVFWQVAGDEGVTIGTDAVFQGVVLARTKVAVNTNAKVVNGRLFAHTAVTLQSNEVTQPAL